MIKNEILSVVKTESDAFKLGQYARKKGKSKYWQPFSGSSEFSTYWERGWVYEDSKSI